MAVQRTAAWLMKKFGKAEGSKRALDAPQVWCPRANKANFQRRTNQRKKWKIWLCLALFYLPDALGEVLSTTRRPT